MTFVGCNSDLRLPNQNETTKVKEQTTSRSPLLKKRKELGTLILNRQLGISKLSEKEFLNKIKELTSTNNITSRSLGEETFNKNVVKAVLDKINLVNPKKYSTFEDYKDALYKVLDENIKNKSSNDYQITEFVLVISTDLIKNKRSYLEQKGILPRSDGWFKPGWWESWGKCAAAVIGSATTNGLFGAIGGSAAPVVGTVTGAVVGAIGGALIGASSAC